MSHRNDQHHDPCEACGADAEYCAYDADPVAYIEAVRAKAQNEAGEAIAWAIEGLINDAEPGASQSAHNEALRMAARIARGEL